MFEEAKVLKEQVNFFLSTFQGKNVEALRKLDELNQVLQQTQGPNSPEVPMTPFLFLKLQPVFNEIAILCNILSMAHL